MASKVSVGKTAPVPLGQQPAANSLPVVFAEDQKPIPVEEQNLVKSEVALSLLGIPRAEVALGIFADVNTYDVNPTEWATVPLDPTTNDQGVTLNGIEHIPEEAGARLVAEPGKTTILTSKRFFRYQPGRVSASTMGVKMNLTDTPTDAMKGAPSIKKWGIFDKFDGYYFEVANNGKKNNFRCVRRTQAIIPQEPGGYTATDGWLSNLLGGANNTEFHTNSNFGEVGEDPIIIRDGLIYVAAAINDPSLVYSPSDVRAIEAASPPENELKNRSFNSDYALRLAYYNGTEYVEHMQDRKFMFPFDQSETLNFEDFLNGEEDSVEEGYIRADAHCNFFQIISNFNRKGSNSDYPTSKAGLQLVGDFWDGSSNYAYSNGDYWDGAANQSTMTNNSDRKIWHLLVNVQGNSKISSGDMDASTILPAVVKTRTNRAQHGNVTLKEWFNLCVPKPYRMVYEWRPVRAMFSGDKLDGETNVVRQSDINTAATDSFTSSDPINRPGEKIELANGNPFETTSAYNIDFTKVTMWKTEFSWYGAVGALFLCYVPIENNEARWVRVHHIRASNQHAVASLGNATLPITYLVHGSPMTQSNQPSEGNTLTKYGASYYIDGGDKGTVRLLSKASDFRREVSPGFVTFPGSSTPTLNNGQYVPDTTNGAITIAAGIPSGDPDSRYSINLNTAVGLMGAYIEGDITTKVKWITESGGGIKLFFENGISSGNPNIKLIVPRAQQSLMSLRAKDFISNREGTAVRNRLQIYPIKLGAGCSGGTTGDVINLRTVKNPLKIVANITTPGANYIYGGTSAAATATVKDSSNNDYVNTKRSTTRKQVYWNTGVNPGSYLADGKYTYGYFLGTAPGDGNPPSPPPGGVFADSNINDSTWFPVLGRLSREGSNYYFSKYYSYPEEIYISGAFLPERHLQLKEYAAAYSTTGWEMFEEISNTSLASHIDYGDQTKWDKLDTSNQSSFVTWEEITRLSGVRVGQDLKLTPIANTGVEILSYYANAGGYQFDLQDYFAYNKEYLSFPLTDEVDLINVYGHYNINSENNLANINPFYVNTAVTWEEQ